MFRGNLQEKKIEIQAGMQEKISNNYIYKENICGQICFCLLRRINYGHHQG